MNQWIGRVVASVSVRQTRILTSQSRLAVQAAQLHTSPICRDGFQKAPGQNPGEKMANSQAFDSKLAKMGIVFTCTVCEARVARTFTRRSYEKGVVIVRLEAKDGCKRDKGHCLHLIADNLGWFEDNPVNVETMLAQRGEAVQRLVVQEMPKSESSGASLPIDAGSARALHAIKTDDGETVEVLLEESVAPASP